jgi:L-ascorbate metabolism protein UlaG (beta-lactamase superfamily)
MHSFEDLTVPENGIGLHWFGQSSYGIKDQRGTIVQTDPYFPHDRPPGRFIHPRPPLDEATLRTDFVLLTHNHGDHTCMETIDRLHRAHPDAKFVGPPESCAALHGNGVPASAISEVTAGDSAPLGSMTAHAVWAKPPDGAPNDGIDPPDVQHLGFVLETEGARVYVSGDPINTFANYETLLAPIRDLRPDIGLLTNHPSEGEFPFFEGSADTATRLGLKAAVPAHYDCFTERTYDPRDWASHLPPNGPKPLIIEYNQSVVFSPAN